MSRLPLLCLFLLLQIPAQSNNIDSLIYQLPTMVEDSIKVNTYQKIADAYLIQQLDSSLLYAKEGLSLARSLKYSKGIIHCLNILGSYYERKTQYDKALIYYDEALVLSRQHQYTKGLAIILNNIAIVYTRTGEHLKALQLYFEALEAEEQLNNLKGIAEAYNNIGVVYYYQKNIDKTLEYFEKSIAIEEELGHLDILKKGYNNIGALYNYQKKYNKALLYYQKSYAISQQLEDHNEMAINLNNIAVAHHALKHLDSAVFYQNKSILLRESLGDYRGAAYSYHNFAAISKDRGIVQEAEDFYLKSLKLSQEKQLKEIESETYKSLADLWQEQQQFEKANRYLQWHINAKDSILNAQNTKAIAEIESKYQTTKKEKEILVQQSQIDQQQLQLNKKNIQLISLGSLSIIFLLIAFLFFNHQKQRNKQLQQEHQLKNAIAKIETQEQLQAQRFQISRDLHDNIGAQLTFIISSIDNLNYGFSLEPLLAKRLEKITQFTSTTIRDLRDTIWAMNQDAISFLDLQQRIHNFLISAQESMQNIDFQFKIAPQLEIDDPLTSVQGMNIYRIIQEAINNAIKHAQANKIEVNVSQEQQQLLIHISDDGKGFDSASTTQNHGLQNMHKRAAEIDGILVINSSQDEGTLVNLSLPMH